MAQYTYYDESLTPIAAGQQNPGAVCWFNSLLQFCVSLPALTTVLLENENEFYDNTFAIEYIKFIKLSQSGAITGNESEHLLRKYHAEASKLDVRLHTVGLGDGCAHEGLVHFIMLLNNKKVERLFENEYEISITCAGCNQPSKNRDTSFKIMMYHAGAIDQKTFTNYIHVHESPHDYYKCSCGHVTCNPKRREVLKRLREIVVVVFCKFYNKEYKYFPEQLRFPGNNGGPDMIYKLVGIIEHSGDMKGGHYWVNVLRGNKWFNINDAGVNSGAPTPTANTFLMAYHLVRDS